MTEKTPDLVYRKDYQAPAYLIDKTCLHIDIQSDVTQVSTQLAMRYNSHGNSQTGQKEALPPLRLDGVDLKLLSLKLDGKALDPSHYRVDKKSLTIDNVPASFSLECVTAIKPEENTALVGLFKTQKLYCTQCEPEGFRRITYYLDRPDVLSEFTTTIEADKARFPVLLSNGNLQASGEIDGNPRRHYATWHDPFPKPSYLFAMVAGNLHLLEETYTTGSGRPVAIKIFTENAQDLAQCQHAMQVTQQAMAWDERVYGREYDLDTFMIAVIAEFNIGGMENKGLNIYRADRLLIDPHTTCDADIQSMTETIAHEYFHNWSGNRVTCRDWFQLSLKEGFTTYRGRQFCHDVYSPAVKRIEETAFLRSVQYAEDASPLSHSIRPEAYRAIWNFYTPTVYRKGSDVVRMLHTLLGQEVYRQGTDLFFERHDGQAATCDDFIAAIETASGKDLTQFKRWYAQAGTPRVNIQSHYEARQKRFTLTVQQHSDPPLSFPLVISLIGQQGTLPITLQGAAPLEATSQVLEITQAEQCFIFEQVNEPPVPSLFQDFSAPVHYHYDYSQQDLLQLLQQNPNGYGRWEAAQRLWIDLIKPLLQTQTTQQPFTLPAAVTGCYQKLFAEMNHDPKTDLALMAQLISLPSTAYLIESGAFTAPIDITGIAEAGQTLRRSFAQALKPQLATLYHRCPAIDPNNITPEAMAQRSIKNTALGYLVATEDTDWLAQCNQQYQSANNMSDTLAALTALIDSAAAQSSSGLRQQALDAFYDRWQHQPLVVNQWFKVQARCPLPDTLARVKKLTRHPAFSLKSPNQVQALIGEFCKNNPINFHNPDGSGYQFLIDHIVELNAINPQIASNLLARSPLINWRRYDKKRQELIIVQLQRLQALPQLASELSEVVDQCLRSDNSGHV